MLHDEKVKKAENYYLKIFGFGLLIIALLLYIIYNISIFLGNKLPFNQNYSATWFDGFVKFFPAATSFLLTVLIFKLNQQIFGLTKQNTETQKRAQTFQYLTLINNEIPIITDVESITIDNASYDESNHSRHQILVCESLNKGDRGYITAIRSDSWFIFALSLKFEKNITTTTKYKIDKITISFDEHSLNTYYPVKGNEESIFNINGKSSSQIRFVLLHETILDDPLNNARHFALNHKHKYKQFWINIDLHYILRIERHLVDDEKRETEYIIKTQVISSISEPGSFALGEASHFHKYE